MDEDTHIFQNYRLCKERFERWAEKGICPSQVLDALTKLEIVEIVLTSYLRKHQLHWTGFVKRRPDSEFSSDERR